MSPQRRFPNEAASVGAARRYVLDAVDDVSSDDADAVAVMISELAANAVRHTGSHFTVAVDRTAEEIRVAVSDSGPGDPVVREPRPEEPSGRGLQIVRALSAEWGVIPAQGTQGKTVWFSIAVDASQLEAADGAAALSQPIERLGARVRGGGTSPSTRGGRGAPANRAHQRRRPVAQFVVA